MRVAVLGAGAVGARVARQLLATDSVGQVLLRDVDATRLTLVSRSLGDHVVAESGPFGPDLDPPDVSALVIATPPGDHAVIARTALNHGISVVTLTDDIADTRALLELDAVARNNEQSLVIGAGFAPGLTCVLAAHGAAWFDEVREIHVAKVGTGGPACARVHHRALSATAWDWRSGEWIRRRGGSGRELCWFPDPVSARDCYRAALPDAVVLHETFPEVDRITSRMAATRRDRLTASLPMLSPPHAEGGPGAVRVELRGTRDGRAEIVALGAMDRPAVAAAAVAATTCEWLLTQRVDRRGACGLGGFVEPVPFLEDLRARGVRSAVFDGVISRASNKKLTA